MEKKIKQLEKLKSINKKLLISFIVLLIILVVLILVAVIKENYYEYYYVPDNNCIRNEDINLFNSKFIQCLGTMRSTSVKNMVNNIITTNAQNEEHKIDVTYYEKINGEEVVCEEEYIADYGSFSELFNKISSRYSYSVTREFDEEGYINKIIITKIL